MALHPSLASPGLDQTQLVQFAWRGETIAVIDLDAYFSTVVSGSGNDTGAESTLLIADCSGLAIGLLVPVVGLTTETQAETPVLDIPAILVDVVQQIRDACPS